MTKCNYFLWSIFILYTILFESMVWGGFFYIVFMLDSSALWAVLAVILSSSQFKPYHFGLITKEQYGDTDDTK